MTAHQLIGGPADGQTVHLTGLPPVIRWQQPARLTIADYTGNPTPTSLIGPTPATYERIKAYRVTAHPCVAGLLVDAVYEGYVHTGLSHRGRDLIADTVIRRGTCTRCDLRPDWSLVHGETTRWRRAGLEGDSPATEIALAHPVRP